MTTGKTVLILGGTSATGRATALRYAEAGWAVILGARTPEEPRRNADDIAVRSGGSAQVQSFDVLRTDQFGTFLDGLGALPDTVVSVIGELGDQARAERDV